MGSMTSEALVIDGCAIATVDDQNREYDRGHLVIRDGWIDVVADGPAPARLTERAVSMVRGAWPRRASSTSITTCTSGSLAATRRTGRCSNG
jgi:hypothetical protein